MSDRIRWRGSGPLPGQDDRLPVRGGRHAGHLAGRSRLARLATTYSASFLPSAAYRMAMFSSVRDHDRPVRQPRHPARPLQAEPPSVRQRPAGRRLSRSSCRAGPRCRSPAGRPARTRPPAPCSAASTRPASPARCRGPTGAGRCPTRRSRRTCPSGAIPTADIPPRCPAGSTSGLPVAASYTPTCRAPCPRANRLLSGKTAIP